MKFPFICTMPFRMKSVLIVILQSEDIFNVHSFFRVLGIFDLRTPVVMIRDPQLIKRLLVTDFDHFQNHNFIVNRSMDVLFGNSLFQLRDKQWKDMRTALSPVFTASKLKTLFDVVVGVADRSTKFANSSIAGSQDVLDIEMKEFCSRCTSDVIAEFSYGIEMNSHENRQNEFYLAGESIREFGGPTIMPKIMLNKLFPSLYRKLGISVFDGKLMKFFRYLISTTFDYRSQNNIRRPDLLQTLLDIGKSSNNSNAVQWSDDELISQSFVFFIGGFDTLSTLISFTCYELAKNPLIQEKAYEEALEVSQSIEGRKLTYEDVNSMKYLSLILQETLRLWPPAAIVDRHCGKDYKLKDEETGLDYTIEKGSTIWIPIHGIQMDPKFYSEPTEFIPERFGDENNNTKENAAPFLSFGFGPRNCIGNRFALLVAKVIMYHFLLKFEIVVIEKTQIPIKIVPSLIGLTSERGVWVGLKRRNN